LAGCVGDPRIGRFRMIGDSEVRKSIHPLFVLVLSAAAVVTWALAGCSENARQKASRKLLDQVASAEQSYQRAAALLGNPVFSVNGTYTPVQSPVPANADVEVAPMGTLHPEVLDDLDKIEKLLTSAIADAGQAAPEDVAIAQMMLGRTYALRGYCLMFEAYGPLKTLHDARKRAGDALVSVQNGNELVTFYKSLANLSDAGLTAARDQALADKLRIDNEIKDIDDRLADLAKEKEAQTAIYQEKNAEARAKQSESAAGSPREGLKKLDESLALKTEANKAESAMAEIERATFVLHARRETQVIELSGAEAKIEAADQEIAARNSTVERNTADATKAEAALAQKQRALNDLLGAMAQASEQMAAADRKAVGEYDKAFNQFKQAGAGAPSSGVKQADALMRIAEAKAQDVRELEVNIRFLQSLRAACQDLPGGVPTQAGRIVAFLPESDADKSAAVADYKEAAGLYEQAVRTADRNYKWAYLGQVASAYADLYELDGSAEALQAARQALSEALEGRENAPALKPLKDLQEALAAKG
jgi:hypothetical protein